MVLLNEFSENIADDEISHLINICNGKEPTLFHLRLLLTNRCNLKCSFCVSQDREIDISKEVPDGRYVLCIKDAIDLGLRYLRIIGGGEAMLRKSLINKMLIIKKENPKVFFDIQTNGTLFSDHQIKEFVEFGWDKVSISIEGPDANTNDLLRGKGTFEKIIKTVQRFNYWKNINN